MIKVIAEQTAAPFLVGSVMYREEKNTLMQPVIVRTPEKMNHRHKTIYYIVNGITMYRLVSAPFLLLLALAGNSSIFKWLIAFSFFTDAIDGPLSRRFRVTSVFGARLDSVADDATVLVSTIGLWWLYPDFLMKEWIVILGLLSLFAVQTTAALVAYKRVTSFHTYLAKAAAVAQAVFFIMIFFDFGPVLFMFYTAAFITGVQLLEEIILVIVLPEWRSDVKGLYWVLKDRKTVSPADQKIKQTDL